MARTAGALSGEQHRTRLPIRDRREIHRLASQGLTPAQISARLSWREDVVKDVLASPPEPPKHEGRALAARRIGITVEEYETRRGAGERWCKFCRRWVPAVELLQPCGQEGERCRGCRRERR
jgi:hypothetical protein